MLGYVHPVLPGYGRHAGYIHPVLPGYGKHAGYILPYTTLVWEACWVCTTLYHPGYTYHGVHIPPTPPWVYLTPAPLYWRPLHRRMLLCDRALGSEGRNPLGEKPLSLSGS